MVDLNPDHELSKIVRSLMRSTTVYADALARITQRTASVDAMTRAVTLRLGIDSKLFGSTNAILDELRQLRTISPSIESIVSANSSFTGMVERISAGNTAITKVFEDQQRLRDMIVGIDLSDSVTAAFARIDTTKMLSVSLAAQTKLAKLDNMALGRIARLDPAFTNALTVNLGNLTRSYESLIDGAASRESPSKGLPFIATYAPVEIYREIDVLETITLDDIDEAAAEPINDSIVATLPSVDDLLAEFDDRLCHLLHGARRSLQGDNPDRTRHVTTSIRELFTQTLHALAPDDEVRQWTSSSKLFHNNRPTRRARILFICRNINYGPLSRFVEADVCAALIFVDSLSSGTHVVESKLSHLQLSSMVSRMESLLVFLLQFRKHGQA